MLRLTSLFLFATSLNGLAAGVSFPPNETCLSPDGKWVVFESTAPADDERKLSLAPAGARKEARPLWTFGRSCDILWSPDSKHIALTDWEGSSSSRIEIIEVGAVPKITELGLKGVKQMMAREELEGHCYYEATQWEDATHLRVCVDGHLDEAPGSGFECWFSVEITTGRTNLISRKRT